VKKKNRRLTGVLRVRAVVLVAVLFLLLLLVVICRRVERLVLHFGLRVFLRSAALRDKHTSPRQRGVGSRSRRGLCAAGRGGTSPSGSRKDQPPCSKKPSGSSTMVFMILVQFRDWTPSVYLMSHELQRRKTIRSTGTGAGAEADYYNNINNNQRT